ncbi:MAG: hypothetical protein ABJH82_13185 [Polaribacter sp.]|uniref:hypothetical protein n=1 Tax=Polaribacter sp. TaxID=1920175 RepID=UPI00326511D9
MDSLPENTKILLLSILLFITVILIYFTIDYKRMKVLELNKLDNLFSEIEYEKLIAKQLEKVPKEIYFIKKGMQQKLQKIKVDILNINFTLNELLT